MAYKVDGVWRIRDVCGRLMHTPAEAVVRYLQNNNTLTRYTKEGYNCFPENTFKSLDNYKFMIEWLEKGRMIEKKKIPTPVKEQGKNVKPFQSVWVLTAKYERRKAIRLETVRKLVEAEKLEEEKKKVEAKKIAPETAKLALETKSVEIPKITKTKKVPDLGKLFISYLPRWMVLW